MTMKLLNPFSLPNGYTLKFDEPYLGSEDDDVLKVITNDEMIIIQKVMPPLFGKKEYENIPGFSIFQIELPLAAAKWLVDTIENKLWKSAAQGGLPSGVNSDKEYVNGEKLALYRQMQVEGVNQKGFQLTNFSRKDHEITDECQDFYFTDCMLIEGKLLDFLKTL